MTISQARRMILSKINGFLPVTKEEMTARGWDSPDFVYVSGDAYVDHPAFGAAIITRVLENAGFRVALFPTQRLKRLLITSSSRLRLHIMKIRFTKSKRKPLRLKMPKSALPILRMRARIGIPHSTMQ